jgi:hypothetical protein
MIRILIICRASYPCSIHYYAAQSLPIYGDTFWIQLTGTGMGTPPAPMYATLYHVHSWVQTFTSIWPFMSFGKLTWEVHPLTTSVVFPDLTISLLLNGRFDTRPYEKTMKLYLYLQPNSTGVLKGLIISLLLRIHWLTSDSSLHLPLSRQLFNCLLLHVAIAKNSFPAVQPRTSIYYRQEKHCSATTRFPTMPIA